MDHNEARMLASARADGELASTLERPLSEHLSGCASCRAFAEALPRLSALAGQLPRERAPATLPAMVRSSLPHARRAPRRLWRPVPALAAVLAVVVLAIVVAPTPGIRVPRAAAADALRRISTVEVERQILDYDEGSRTPTGTTHERVWFRAPGMVRIERDVIRAGGTPVHTLEISRPGERYTETDSVGRRETGLLPDAALPEPLSPTISLVGVDRGPGPEVAGRATRRYEVDLGPEKRVAFVDAQTFSILGDDESVILGKETRVPGLGLVRSKRTLSVRYNAPLSDDLFRIPDIAETDRGFRPKPPALLSAPPKADPEGFRVTRSGAGPDGEAVLYTRGALPVLVTIDAASVPDAAAETRPVRVGQRAAVLTIGLFGLPRVSLNIEGHAVAVSAPLPEDALITLAALLYP